MVQVEVYPYNSFREKLHLINTEFRGKKFMDLDGCLYHIDYVGQDEPSASILCRAEKLGALS